VKNEEELRHVGNTYDLVYLKAHPSKVGAIPLAEIFMKLTPYFSEHQVAAQSL